MASIARRIVGRVSWRSLHILRPVALSRASDSCSCHVRWQHSDVQDVEDKTKSRWDFTPILRWFGVEEPKEVDESEMRHRMDLLQRVREMYYSKPPKTPDYEFYKEAVQAMIKYKDRRAVETLCEMMNEVNIEVDIELQEEIDKFLQKHWYEDYF